MQVFAHRGFHIEVPENTIEAFKAAREIGIDGIETDVRLSGDGVPILFHDRNIQSDIPVSELNIKQIDHLMGFHVPTLDEALKLDYDIIWNLEIKSRSAVKPTIEIMRQYMRTQRFLVTSFIHSTVFEITRELNVEGGLLIAHTPLTLEKGYTTNPRVRTLVWDFETMDKFCLEEAVNSGIQNFVYGPVTKAEHDEALSFPIKAIITDMPPYVNTLNTRGEPDG